MPDHVSGKYTWNVYVERELVKSDVVQRIVAEQIKYMANV